MRLITARKASKALRPTLLSTQKLKEFFDECEYCVFRILLFALLLISAYRILDREIKVSQLLSEMIRLLSELMGRR